MPEYELPELGEIPEGYFEAAGKITSGELVGILNGISNVVRQYHVSTVTPSLATRVPGQSPTIVQMGNVIGLSFATGNVAHRIFKIPKHYTDSAAFHAHWTKSSDVANEQGNTVRWRVEYTVWPGNNGPLVGGGADEYSINLDDTYEDASIGTGRIAYRTPSVAAEGFIAGYYVGVKVDVDFGSTTVTDPTLVSVDLTFNETINK